MELILDVNTQVYPVDLGDKFRLALVSTLREDGVVRLFSLKKNDSFASKETSNQSLNPYVNYILCYTLMLKE